MKELLRTTNAVLISRVRALLNGEEIPFFHLDYNASVVEGSIGALPQRIMVDESDMNEARKTLQEAGLGDSLAIQD